jgi:predicted dehydrogenase
MEKIKVGVIGVGHLGSLHTKMFSTIESVKLEGIYDADIERAKKVAGEFHTNAFNSVDELLKKVDAVSIATPTSAHHEVALEALNAGKHIFIEKPITKNAEQAGDLIRKAREKNLKIQVGHIERFNPALLSIDRMKLQPLFIESHRLAQFNPRGTDVAVIHDLMIHDIDIILSLVKSKVISIAANGVAVVTNNIDIANARIQFESGCVANVTASRISASKMRKMRLFQRDAYISLNFLEGTTEVFKLIDANDNTTPSTLMLGMVEAANKKIIYDKPARKEVNALKYELELFIDCILNDKEPEVTAEDGKRALEVAHEIIKKIEEQNLIFANKIQ